MPFGSCFSPKLPNYGTAHFCGLELPNGGRMERMSGNEKGKIIMNSMQTKMWMYVGLVLIANLLFPPVRASNGGREMGRNFLGWDSKFTTYADQDGAGKWVEKKQQRPVEVDLTRLVVSESFILGGALLLFGLLADEEAVKRRFGKKGPRRL